MIDFLYTHNNEHAHALATQYTDVLAKADEEFDERFEGRFGAIVLETRMKAMTALLAAEIVLNTTPREAEQWISIFEANLRHFRKSFETFYDRHPDIVDDDSSDNS